MSSRPRAVAPAFIKPKALYLIPHQDDEILTAGGAITDDVHHGLDVHVLLVTDGAADPVRVDGRLSAFLGHTPSPEEFTTHRDREFGEGVRRMGATALVPPARLRQPDGASTVRGITALARERAFEGAALRATSTYDYHRDHRRCGRALEVLWKAGFGHDPRLLIGDFKKELLPPRTQHHRMGEPDCITDEHLWSYAARELPDWWGVGTLSVPAWFHHSRHISATTHWHRPVPLGVRVVGPGPTRRRIAGRLARELAAARA